MGDITDSELVPDTSKQAPVVIPQQFACFPTVLEQSERDILWRQLKETTPSRGWMWYERWIYELVVRQDGSIPMAVSVIWHAVHIGCWIVFTFVFTHQRPLSVPLIELRAVAFTFFGLQTLFGLFYTIGESQLDRRNFPILAAKSFIPGFRPVVALLSWPILLLARDKYRALSKEEERIRCDLLKTPRELVAFVYGTLLQSMEDDLIGLSPISKLITSVGAEIDRSSIYETDLERRMTQLERTKDPCLEALQGLLTAARTRHGRLKSVREELLDRRKRAAHALDRCRKSAKQLSELMDIGRVDRSPGEPVGTSEPTWTAAAEESAKKLLKILQEAYRDFRWAIDPDVLEEIAKLVPPKESVTEVR